MKKKFAKLIALVLLAIFFVIPDFSGTANAQGTSRDGIWSDVTNTERSALGLPTILPQIYRSVTLDVAALQQLLRTAPLEGSTESQRTHVTFSLPLPDGSFGRFQIVESPIMAPELAAKFPEIKTYAGQGIDDHTATVRFDWTPAGFHAMIISASDTVYIDPYNRGDTTHYISYYKRDFQLPADKTFIESALPAPKEIAARTADNPQLATGTQLRTYRLAVAADGEYTIFQGGTVPLALAAIVTTVNRVDGIYEREVAVRMVLVANNNLIIYTNPATDPYTDNDPNLLLPQNQANLDVVIGSANYDVGHVFTTGGGGLAAFGVVCNNSFKAQGETGSSNPVGDPFDVDYVAHELGHQFSANHTFNGDTGFCSGNGNASTAYEPGSGSTIMAYAGICSPQDLQPNSTDLFHGISLDEITAFTQTGGGNSCAVTTTTTNNPPTVNAGVGGFTIPAQTPFSLTGSATDPNSDALTYNWEEFDLGTAGAPDNPLNPPFFRSMPSSTDPTRTFPRLSDLLNNTLTIGEVLPNVTRSLTFRLTARDNRLGGGGVNSSNITFNVTTAAGPFVVTSPNTAVSWVGNTVENITWNVANTNVAPVSCATATVSLSTDGGLTYPQTYTTPNDGSDNFLVPNVNTTTARVRVGCANNIFFDVSNTNFSITPAATAPNINVDVVSISSTQAADSTTNQSFNIGNDGTVGLDWSIDEINTVAPIVAKPASGQTVSRTGITDNTKPVPYLVTSSSSETFDDMVLPGWAMQNNSSPTGTTAWFQGNPVVFSAHSGAANAYIAANYENTSGAGTISNWLLTPQLSLHNGDSLSFWTRATGAYADRLQVRLSTAGASTNVGTLATDVGDFTTVLLDINPTLIPSGYPSTWTLYTATLSGLPATGTSGRFAWRYFVTDGGPSGTNSDYIGIDTIQFDSSGSATCLLLSDVPWLSVSPASGSTAPGSSTNVQVTFDATGLTVGTYTGNLCINSNDPDPGLGNGTNQVVIPISLTIAPIPPNNDFANAEVISGASGTLSATNIGANKETGEPDHAGNPGGTSIWYEWVAPASGNKTFDTLGSAIDTLLGVYTGSSVDALTEIGSSDNCAPPAFFSCVSFSATSGVTYLIAVDGFNGDAGALSLNWADGDITPPTVLSITRATVSPTALASVDFIVTFSEPVTGVDAGDFTLTTTGAISGVTVSLVSGSGTSYTVTVNTGSNNGSIRLDVVDNNSIVDAASNPLGGAIIGDGDFTSGEIYSVIKSATFADVPLSYWSWGFIERLYNAGITGGCGTGPLIYCPDNTVTRAQMAVFLLRGIHGRSYAPPTATGTVFTDVSASSFAAAWIEQLALEGITGGCGVGTYCPDATVTRAQMAIFLLRSKHGSTYAPPSATGTVFTDVSTSSFAAAWIEQLALEEVTGGCGSGKYCPDGSVTRAEMAVFLVRTFNLP